MRSKAFSKPFRVDFVHSGRDRTRSFKTFEEAKMFASNFSKYQIVSERGQDGNAADC